MAALIFHGHLVAVAPYQAVAQAGQDPCKSLRRKGCDWPPACAHPAQAMLWISGPGVGTGSDGARLPAGLTAQWRGPGQELDRSSSASLRVSRCQQIVTDGPDALSDLGGHGVVYKHDVAA